MSNEHDAHPEPVTVGAFGSVGEAEVAQAKLRSFGVDSAIVDNEGGGTIPVEGEEIALQVAATDADTARDVLST
jgi:hypothetical protein